ncbi:MAG: hypothetical protein RLZZ241_1125, partial [Bacteroidota bacterium]
MKNGFILLLVLLYSFSGLSQSITVTSPNGGERISSCVNFPITWQSSGTSGYFNIYYSENNGQTWVSIATSYNSVSNTFNWNVPNVNSVNALVRVTDATNEAIQDQSNDAFVIDGALILLYPQGNENFVAGNDIDIIYSYNVGEVSRINVQYSVDDGQNWITEATNIIASGNYTWRVPNLPNNSLTKIRLLDYLDSSCKVFENEINFSITSSITVLDPNGGEFIKASVGAQGTPVIMNNVPQTLNTGSFYDDGGRIANYSNQSYIKTLSPDFPTNKLRATFQDFAFENGDKLLVFDGGDISSPLLGTIQGNFTNQLVYTATNLKGQLTFQFISDNDNLLGKGWDAIITSIGTEYFDINWNIVGTSKYFNLDYSTNSGSTWIRIISNYYSINGNFPWSIPNTPTSNARIKITDAQNGNIIDISDTDFTIIEADPFIQLYNPNGGEELFPTELFQINWNSAFFNSNVKLEYSINNGVDWITIISATPSIAKSFNWLVPQTPSEEVLVRVSDPDDVAQNDQSDGVFTIHNYI